MTKKSSLSFHTIHHLTRLALFTILTLTTLQGNSYAGTVEVTLFRDLNFNGELDEPPGLDFLIRLSNPRLYLTGETNGTLVAGTVLPVDESGITYFFDVPNGTYSVIIEYDDPFVTPLLGLDRATVTISDDNPFQSVLFGYMSGLFDGTLLPTECRTRQQEYVQYDGRAPGGFLCEHVSHIEVVACCGNPLSDVTPILQSNHTNLAALSVMWSTGETNLSTQLPHGTHTLTISDLETGCTSINPVTVSSNTLAMSLLQIASVEKGGGCGTNGVIRIVDFYDGFTPIVDTFDGVITDLDTGLPVNVEFDFDFSVLYRNLPAGRYRIIQPVSLHPCDLEFIVTVPETVRQASDAISTSITGGTHTLRFEPGCEPILPPSWITISTNATQTAGVVNATLTMAPNPDVEPRRADFMIGTTQSIVVQPGTRPMRLEISNAAQSLFDRAPKLEIFTELGRPFQVETANTINGPWQIETTPFTRGEPTPSLLMDRITTQRFYRLTWENQ